MPKHPDHPVLLLRVRRGFSRVELAEKAGVTRASIAQIEDGRVQSPKPSTLTRIAIALNIRPAQLENLLATWQGRQSPIARLDNRGRAILNLTPAGVRNFSSFEAWRRNLAPNPTAFASLLGTNRETVAGYEHGVRVNGMPTTLATALLRLGISDEYLTALRSLPPGEDI